MIPLIIATIFSSSFGLVVRYAQGRDRNLLAVGAINYITAAVVNALIAISNRSLIPSRATLIIGFLGGIVYVISYLLLVPSIRLKGVSITTAVVRLSILIPVIFSIFIWNEHPNTTQTFGIILAILSLPMLGIGNKGNSGRIDMRVMIPSIILFFTNGGCLLSIKSFHELGVDSQKELFLAILFGTAAFFAIIAWLLKSDNSSKDDIMPGIALGTCNIFGNLLLIIALERLPGVIVFPFTSSVGLVLATVFAMIAWEERLRKIGIVGIVLATLAAVFINI